MTLIVHTDKAEDLLKELEGALASALGDGTTEMMSIGNVKSSWYIIWTVHPIGSEQQDRYDRQYSLSEHIAIANLGSAIRMSALTTFYTLPLTSNTYLFA
jgi:hypothetical protein